MVRPLPLTVERSRYERPAASRGHCESALAARIISVADVYDSLTSDRPYRKAMSPFEVREILVKGAGTEFDSNVVEAFLIAFRKGDMEVPAVVICPPPTPPKSPTPNPRR